MKIIAAFLVGVVLSSIVAYFLCDFLLDVARTKYVSTVEAPTGAILQDINASIERGDHDLGHRKSALFEKRWAEYRVGGTPPEEFMHEIQALKKEDR